MLAKRTIIGFIVGIIILALGGYSLLSNLGPTVSVNDQFVVDVGEPIFFTIPAPNHAPQYMKITGDTFDLKLTSPSTGLQIPNMTSYKNDLTLDWVHVADGETKIQIQNTGNTELEITGVLIRSSDPIWLTFDLMVIISGMVIIGFSMGFTLRKPKGF